MKTRGICSVAAAFALSSAAATTLFAQIPSGHDAP